MAAERQNVNAADVPVRQLDSRIRRVRGTTLLAGPQQALELNAVADYIWRQIDGIRTIAEIAEEVVREYDIDLETAIQDVSDIVGVFARHGLVGFR